MTFEQLNLNSQITKALALCGYTKPTPIQAKSIPDILLGKDMVASAQTGTGKTAAFVLPALHQLATNAQKTNRTPHVLILTPTRELANQITEAVTKYGKFLNCNIVSLVGGMPYRQQLRNLSRANDIIVATPGRLMDHMNNGRLDLSQVKMLILDEADRMLDMGFIDDVKMIASSMPKNRQTLLFSATVDSRLTQIIRQFLRDPVRIEIESEKMAPTKITQQLYVADHPQHKMQLLKHLVKERSIFKAIIFSGTKINADKLANELCAQGYAAEPLHGDLRQSVRTRTLEKLRRGKIQFLVATDVAARGIDVQDITHVINFDLPKFSEDYVHRIGRTGRAGKEGIAISFALPSDALHVQRIERLLRQTLDRKTVEGLEPKKSLTNSQAPKRNNDKKRKFTRSSSAPASKGKRTFTREGYAPASKGRKTFSREDREDSAPASRGKKTFAREGYAPASKGKRTFTRDDSAPASKGRKTFSREDREGSAPASRGKRTFSREGFAPASKGKRTFTRDDSAPASKGRKTFSREDREGSAPTSRGKKTFAREGFAKRHGNAKNTKKEWSDRPKTTKRD